MRQRAAIGVAGPSEAHPGRLHRFGDACIRRIEGWRLLARRRQAKRVEDVGDFLAVIGAVLPSGAAAQEEISPGLSFLSRHGAREAPYAVIELRVGEHLGDTAAYP